MNVTWYENVVFAGVDSEMKIILDYLGKWYKC